MKQRIMPVKEFVEKILHGERDFSYIKLKGLKKDYDDDFWNLYYELQLYLKNKDFSKNPVILDHANLEDLISPGIYLPFVSAQGTNFERVFFWGANFENANFDGANFVEACLTEACLTKASAKYVKFTKTDCSGANFDGTDLLGATFLETDLRNVKNLEKAINLKHVNFSRTIVTKEELKIIENALKQKPFVKEREKRKNYFYISTNINPYSTQEAIIEN